MARCREAGDCDNSGSISGGGAAGILHWNHGAVSPILQLFHFCSRLLRRSDRQCHKREPHVHRSSSCTREHCLHQALYKKQPIAFFGTIGTGYNPTSSSVEFGVGPSFSWQAIQISTLADIGRDTQLAGGFCVNEPLPVSNAPKPLTFRSRASWQRSPAL